MYLAMLAGGQIMKRIVKKTLRLSGDEGLQIFQFKGMDRKQLRDQIKTTIDSLELSRTTKDAIAEENIRCFRMNIQIVKALPLNWGHFQNLAVLVAVVMVIFVAYLYWYGMFS